jgi:hypothetical protein
LGNDAMSNRVQSLVFKCGGVGHGAITSNYSEVVEGDCLYT